MPTGLDWDAYSEIWLIDYEFGHPPGGRPKPVCLAAKELRSGRTILMWEDELRDRRMPPYPIGPDSLIVAFLASAELGCHLALGWPMPERVLDLYVEFKHRLNGLIPPHGWGLLGALLYFGLDAMDAVEKESMRSLALRGGPWTGEEKEALLAYCMTDVTALERLLPAMQSEIDLPRAVACRGRYMAAVAHMEWDGVPLDLATLGRLRDHWSSIQDRLIADVDSQFGVFDGRTFKTDRWTEWVARRGIPWPTLESGGLALDRQTFREMARGHRDVSLMRELRHALSELRLVKLEVGEDGKNRALLSPFRARTSRNQPSSSKFVFGPATWIRGLIKPGPDRALAYVDWSQQEFGIAAALSGDAAMAEAYLSGDPYLTFGKQCGRIPPDGTKKTWGAERDLCKTCVLGVQYGMEAMSLARRIGLPPVYARELLRQHRETYPRFWKWSDGAEAHAMLCGWIATVFGWTLHTGSGANPRSIRNFGCQANGAELLRLACCLATEGGISVIAPVHDALMIEGPVNRIDELVARTQAAMLEASRIVLDGFPLRSDFKIVRWPGRYMDERGREFWDRVMALLPTDESRAG
jgi:hypothetical protein